MSAVDALETPLTEDEAAQLRDDGYVVVRQVLPEHVLQSVRDALAAVVDRMAREWHEEGVLADLHEDAPFTTRWARIREQVPAVRPVTWRRVLVSEAMYALWQRPELTGRMRSVLGDELWAHDTWNGRPREPRAAVQKITWHQDAYYLKGWQPSDGTVLTCWIPLVPVDARSGCLQILPASHLRGVLPKRRDRFFNSNIAAEHLENVAPVTLPATPGDVVIFTESTVHQALHNESDFVRWTVDIRFGRDSAAMREKAKGGYLCRTAGDPAAILPYPQWAAKYDRETGSMGPFLRAMDAVAERSGAMGRDIRTY